MTFFGLLGLFFFLVAIVLGAPVLTTFLETGLVPRVPTAILVVGLGIIGSLSIFAGLILQMITHSRQELKRLLYLSVPNRIANRPTV